MRSKAVPDGKVAPTASSVGTDDTVPSIGARNVNVRAFTIASTLVV
jgi:hypothetical protein